jgi:hypothetical protein
MVISEGVKEHIASCVGSVRELRADNSVVTNFRTHGLACLGGAAYAGFLAKVRAKYVCIYV